MRSSTPLPRWIALAAILASIAAPLAAQHGPPDLRGGKTGLISNEEGAYAGYTLFTPLQSTSTYLIDMEGEVVHEWKSEYTPGHAVYLLPTGNLLRAGRDPENRIFHAGGEGGLIQEIAWDGEIVWEYAYSSDEHLQHHDLEPLPNGNVLLVAWERKTPEEAIAAGRDPEMLEAGEMWVDHIVEIQPVRPDGGKIVWEWHAWDHLIQDRDREKAGYGVVADHPELIDVNADRKRRRPSDEELDDLQERLRKLGYVGNDPEDDDRGPGGRMRADWTHVNSVDYNPALDQILLSVHSFSEIWVIDHGTTTEEAAGHEGGRWGKGGDLLYRWGNPQSWGAGTPLDRSLYAQHDARWIRGGDGSWSILVFNNGMNRPDGNYSSVDQLRLPFDEELGYRREEEGGFGPEGFLWSYTAPRKGLFYSSHISGAQRLPNGNTLVCSGEQGRFFEVTPAGETVWEYVNPFRAAGRRGSGDRARPEGPGGPPDRGSRGGRRGPRGPGGGPSGGVFRATRLSGSHPGLAKLVAATKDS